MIQGIHYLDSVLEEMAKQWPFNRTINIVCHGHSVPAGYSAVPVVNPFHAYPHLLHRMIKERFPFAVVNVIVTGIGGEHAIQGVKRFESDVLNHKPDVLTIDYALNDKSDPLDEVAKAWESMITKALEQDVKVILCTPTWEQSYLTRAEDWKVLVQHAEQIRELADRYNVGLADSFTAFEKYVTEPEKLTELLSGLNHPTKAGHQLVAKELAKYFMAR